MEISARSTHIRWIIIASIGFCVAVALSVSFVLLAHPMKRAASLSLQAGTYTIKTYFPATKQTEYGTLTLIATKMDKQSGLVTVTYPSLHLSGKGWWWIDSQQHITNYTFREPFIKKGIRMDIQVSAQELNPGPNTSSQIIATGNGIVYQADVPLSKVDTISYLTPLD